MRSARLDTSPFVSSNESHRKKNWPQALSYCIQLSYAIMSLQLFFIEIAGHMSFRQGKYRILTAIP